MSTSLKVVSIAVVFFASTNRRLMVRRRLLIFSGFSSRLNIGTPMARPGFGKAFNTSCFIILPLAPLGVMFDVSTFLSAIIAAATGDAFKSGLAAAGWRASVLGCAAAVGWLAT